MKCKDNGLKLIKVLQKQRKFFIRLNNSERQIADHLIHYSLDQEAFELQKKIGLENKKKIAKELKGKPFPNECGSKVRKI